MGIFSKEPRDYCYFCNNDYFELIKTLDNKFVCTNCIKDDDISKDEIIFMSLDEIIKVKSNFSSGEKSSHDTYCYVCNKHIESGSRDYVSINTNDYCKSCGSEKLKSIDGNVLIASSPFIAGYDIEEHLDLISVESLITLSYNMNLEAQSIFGKELKEKDLKFKEAKNLAIMKLKIAAEALNGHAVINVNLSSSVFFDKRSVVATGTVVKIKESKH